jgi:hypothetical protein
MTQNIRFSSATAENQSMAYDEMFRRPSFGPSYMQPILYRIISEAIFL